MNNKELLQACYEGNLDTVDRLLHEPSTPLGVFDEDEDGDSYLALACMSMKPEMVKRILADKRIEVNMQNNRMETPIIVATNILIALEGRLLKTTPNSPAASSLQSACNTAMDILKLLLEDKRVDPNSRNIRGETPLIMASMARCEEVVDLLLAEPSVDPSLATFNGKTALWVACRVGCYPIVAKLAEDERVKFHAHPVTWSPLGVSARYGHVKIFKYLWDHPNSERHTKPLAVLEALHGAAKACAGTEIMAHILPNLSTELLNSGDFGGGPVVTVACISGNLDCLNLLLTRPDLNLSPAEGAPENDPLLASVGSGHLEIVRRLLQDPRVNPHAIDSEWSTAIHIASELNRTSILEVLLADGRCDPDALNVSASTALQNAFRKGLITCVRILLADPRVDPNGPLLYDFMDAEASVFSKKSFAPIWSELFQHPRINLNATDPQGHTTVWNFCYHGYYDALKWLLACANNDLRLDDKPTGAEHELKELTAMEVARARLAKVKEISKRLTLDVGILTSKSIQWEKCYTLIRSFKKDPWITQLRLRTGLGIVGRAPLVFSYIAFFTDEILELTPPQPNLDDGDEKRQRDARRFFRIAHRLNFDVQLVLARREAGSAKDSIPLKDRLVGLMTATRQFQE